MGLILAQGNILVWISLHGCARANLCRLVLRAHIHQTRLPINHILGVLSCAKGVSYSTLPATAAMPPRLTYPSRLLISVATPRRRFLAYVDFGSLALPVKCFRRLLAALLPHDATTRQRNGWPSLTTMRGFCCCASHIHSRGNMRAASASVFGVSLSTAHDRAIAASRCCVSLATWR